MRIKMFFFLLLPFLVFGGDCKFKPGERYIFDAIYSISKENKFCYSMIYDVLSVDEKGVALVSCSCEGQIPPFCVGWDYNVFISSEGKISSQDYSFCRGATCKREVNQAKLCFFPFEYYYDQGLDEFSMQIVDFDKNIMRYTFVFQNGNCLPQYTHHVVLEDFVQGVSLQLKCWKNKFLYFELNRRAQ